MAVGSFQVAANDFSQPLAEHWNGRTWAIGTVPMPSGAVGSTLAGVSCASAANCTAAGYYIMPIGHNHLNYAVAEHWNGSAWTVQPSPNPANPDASLAGVACSSATSCTAVGNNAPAVGVFQTLAEGWNGSTWVIQPTPNPARTQSGSLTGLWGASCTTASSGTAAATFGPTNFTSNATAEYWNGTAWTIQATAPPVARKHLVAVSCVSAHVCTAVGGSFTKGTNRLLQQPLAEHE
jgi:hypothetical protein